MKPEPPKGDDTVTRPAIPERTDTRIIKPLNLAFIPENSVVGRVYSSAENFKSAGDSAAFG